MYQFSSPFLPKCTGFIPPPPPYNIIEEYIPLDDGDHAWVMAASIVIIIHLSSGSTKLARRYT